MRKLLLLLAALLLMIFPALAEETADPAMLDLTHLKQVSEGDVPRLAQQIQDSGASACDLRGVYIVLNNQIKLVEACPRVDFYWTVKIDTTVIDNHLTHLNLDEIRGKVGHITLQKVLRCLSGVEEVTMYNYRFSVKEMENIMAAFPQIHFNWTIRINTYLIRNDSSAFSTAKGRQDPRYTAKQLADLKHCPDLVAVDVGHNNVSDLSFLTQWPHLKRLICIDSRTPVTDLSPLAELHELEYLELFMQQITDLSPLAGKEHLLDLNLCYNNITDLTPLHSCVNLERLWISNNKNLPQEQIDALQAALPNLVIETQTKQSTGAGWREHPRYFIMKESFDTRTYIPFTQE